ncbi:conserved hypothetical protein [Candidatus Protochlamydia naegleriophila]|uniref:Uncharacterized protein n=1 Tax=Candidatus Protochlamydia naegleriophila TaxID=389348 RepID=A0A0U5J6U9_9BACT|nr:hypothetical protein [Candidatus Protochlamydia naegleriophila]CUI15785.1 conserved hypothetical protein [Candidatus Protochlamydia naegleriophila]
MDINNSNSAQNGNVFSIALNQMSKEVDLSVSNPFLALLTNSTLAQADQNATILGLNQPRLASPDEISINTSTSISLLTALNSASLMINELLSPDSPAPLAQGALAADVAVTGDAQSTSDGSLITFLTILGKTLTEVKQLQRKIAEQEATDTRALAKALETLSGTFGNDIMQKVDLLNNLEDLRKNGAQNISTGRRYILGEHPELMLQLAKYGIVPPAAGGGPFDGMARAAAANNQPPYDNPVYKAMAAAIPSGWEELSGSELDKVINQLKFSVIKDLHPDLSARTGLAGFLFRSSFESALGLFGVRQFNSEIKLMQMMLLRQQLQEFKNQGPEHISTGERYILGKNPGLMMDMANLGIFPPSRGGGPYDGMAKSYVAEGKAPYDNTLNAAMANSLPSGWEELSTEELDRTIQKLDRQIERQANRITNSALFGHASIPWSPLIFNPSWAFGGLIRPSDIFSPFALTFGAFNPTINRMLANLSLADEGDLNHNTIVNDLLAKVILNQSLAFSLRLGLFPRLSPPFLASHVLQHLIETNGMPSLVGDLMGFARSSVFERDLMKESLIVFAVLVTLSNYSSLASSDSIQEILQSMASLHPELGFYTSIAALMLKGSRQPDLSAAAKGIIKKLAEKVDKDQNLVENLQLLEKMILAMMKKLLEGIPANSALGDTFGPDGDSNSTVLIQG